MNAGLSLRDQASLEIVVPSLTKTASGGLSVLSAVENIKVVSGGQKMPYYLIFCDEDGDVSVEEYIKPDLLKALQDEDYGPIGFIDKLGDNDPQYWGNNALIIKGEIVKPKPKTVFKELEIK